MFEQRGKKIWMGWPANPTKSGPKKQKRGLISSLDSLNLELFAKVFAKKSKKNQKLNYGSHPIESSYSFLRDFLKKYLSRNLSAD